MLKKTEEEKRTLEKVRVHVSFTSVQKQRSPLLLVWGYQTVYLNWYKSAISSRFSWKYSYSFFIERENINVSCFSSRCFHAIVCTNNTWKLLEFFLYFQFVFVLSFTVIHSELHYFLVIKLELPNESKKRVPNFHREDGEEEEEGDFELPC